MEPILKRIVREIKETLTDLEKHTAFADMDESDLGNEIGTVLGRYFDFDEVEAFAQGLEHGISLSNGTHGDKVSADYISITVD